MSVLTVWSTALCAGGSVWLLGGRGRIRSLRRARTVLAVDEYGGREPVWRRSVAWVRRRTGHEVWLLVGGSVIALLGESVVPLLAGAVGMPLAGRVRRARAARRERQRQADAVIALCGVLAGEVRAGRQPGQALRSAVEAGDADDRGLDGARAGVLAAARFGGDVPGALREAAREPGAEGLLGLAACWRVAVDRGAGLATGLERLEGALRAERDQRSDLRAQLAGARSTALMLAGLPALGLLMGAALGARPLRVLLHTGAGLGCLLVGALLEGAGAWWALRIVRRAEGR
ncbi:type II secretion system F family protein [Streptomyces sp. NPDC059063]|uniref:type II secretion system F family protein n=1 Tax=unclassified Streptomyces TaxID=2593676 RepID=UPI0036BF0316